MNIYNVSNTFGIRIAKEICADSEEEAIEKFEHWFDSKDGEKFFNEYAYNSGIWYDATYAEVKGD